MRGDRRYKYKGKRRIQTNKLVDRLFYDPTQGQKKGRKEVRNVIKQKEAGPINSPSHPDLKIGSFNVRGLDQETFWYVEQLVQDRDFDVRYFG